MNINVDANSKGTSLYFGGAAMRALQKIGLGPHAKAVLDQRDNMLLLTSAAAAETLLQAHLVKPVWAVVDHDQNVIADPSDPDSSHSCMARFRMVLDPRDWGRYQIDFELGRVLALGELPSEHRGFTVQ